MKLTILTIFALSLLAADAPPAPKSGALTKEERSGLETVVLKSENAKKDQVIAQQQAELAERHFREASDKIKGFEQEQQEQLRKICNDKGLEYQKTCDFDFKADPPGWKEIIPPPAPAKEPDHKPAPAKK